MRIFQERSLSINWLLPSYLNLIADKKNNRVRYFFLLSISLLVFRYMLYFIVILW